MIRIKRAYDTPAPVDGARFLVDRLWPRGVKKAAMSLAGWPKEAAPSDGLRRWYGHEPAKWAEFQRRYRAELAKNPDALRVLLAAAADGDVCLLFGARNVEQNNATVLKDWLEKQTSNGALSRKGAANDEPAARRGAARKPRARKKTSGPRA